MSSPLSMMRDESFLNSRSKVRLRKYEIEIHRVYLRRCHVKRRCRSIIMFAQYKYKNISFTQININNHKVNSKRKYKHINNKKAVALGSSHELYYILLNNLCKQTLQTK